MINVARNPVSNRHPCLVVDMLDQVNTVTVV
jgi:hypothetical protein